MGDERRHQHYRMDPGAAKDWVEHGVGCLLLFLSLLIALGVLVALGMALAGWFIDLTG